MPFLMTGLNLLRALIEDQNRPIWIVVGLDPILRLTGDARVFAPVVVTPVLTG